MSIRSASTTKRFSQQKFNFSSAVPVVFYASDPQFNLSTLLLHGDGTNGANNTVFLDSGPSAFAITQNGRSGQGTFSPFSQTGWSNYFNNATSDYLSPASSSNLAFGVNNYTVEFWIYLPAYTNTSNRVVDLGSATGSFGVSITNSGTITVNKYGSSDILTSSANFILNQWNHIAVVRSGTGTNQLVVYINGTNAGAATDSNNWTVVTTPRINGLATFTFGWTGYLSNLRVLNGTAQYTSNFTPPTSPLPAITNTVLLTSQSNRYIDNSTNAFTITPSGTPSVQPFSPLAPSAAYSTSTVGGSLYFNGQQTANITASSSTTFNLTGDFTLEAWVYPTAYPGGDWGIIDARAAGGTAAAWLMNITSSTGWKINFYDGTARPGATAVPLNTWTHICYQRTGSVLRGFYNGVLDYYNGTYGTGALSPSTTAPVIGTKDYSISSAWGTTGYISNLRVVNGSSVYSTSATTVGTAVFTPSTSPLTSVANTILLNTGTNAGIFDQTGKNNITTYGSAAISTTQSKFGGSSILFNGTTDYLLMPGNYNGTFGTGNFTIEAWIYVTYAFGTTGQGRGVIASNRSAATGSTDWSLQHYNGKLYFSHASTDPIVGVASLTTNTWTHVAVVRNGTALTSYINGVQDVSVTNSDNFSDNQPIGIGVQPYATNYPFTGYIDDLRITKYARYTSNFTPPTSAFLNQ